MNTRNEVQPNYTSDRGLPLNEAQNPSKIDYLIRIGLGDQNKIPYYRRVAASPKDAIAQQYLRPYAAEILEKLLEMVFTDSFMWNRVKTLLLRDNKSTNGLTEDISDDGLRSLIEKAVENEISLEVLFQVYSRGAALQEHYPHKTGEQLGFNRVNSFLAGGKARYDDADLLGENKIVREDNKNKNTLSLIKRVLRESKEKN